MCLQHTVLHNFADLYHNRTARIVYCGSYFQLIGDHRFMGTGNIAALIRIGAANEANMDGKGRVKQHFLAVDMEQLHNIFTFFLG